ncbi:MAG: hypothetical protein RLZZ135_1954, partial [Cyanobacteriota bacterium]
DTVDFTLQLDDPDSSLSQHVTLQGSWQQLNSLQQVTGQYIAELVAKFPLPTINDRAPKFNEPESPSTDRSTTSEHQLNPPDRDREHNLEISTNESELEDQFSEESVSPASLFSLQSVSKLLGHSDDRPQGNPNFRQQPLKDPVISNNMPQPPTLIGGESSLDHKLHLGDLATPKAGAVLTISAIQLFDLATVLDECCADEVNNPQQIEAKTPDRSIGSSPANASINSEPTESDVTTSSLSRLPNLPKLPAAEPEHSRVHRRRRSRSGGFKSAIPWAAAAAIAVGGSFLLLNKSSNPPKQSADKVTAPTTAQSPNPIAKGTAETSSQPSPTAAGLPAPWQAQPVQPPQQNPTLPAPIPQQTQTQADSSKIGLAPLPASILGIASSVPQTAVNQSKTRSTATASTPSLSPKNTTLIPPTTTTRPGNSGKPSVSQPLPILQDQPETPTIRRSIVNQNPLQRQGNNPGRKVNPNLINPEDREESTPITGDNSQSNLPTSGSKENGITPLPKIDPRALPANPNIIASPTESSTPQVIPQQPLPSNVDRVGPNTAENPSLQQATRYFQSKWKAAPNQVSSLQYVLEVNGKSGVVQNVDPQGEAATNYLKQSKMIKPGQKLVAPIANAGNQKIRVLLQPDGNVETLIEP